MQKTQTQIAKEIQVILFYLAEPVSFKFLAEMIGVSEKEIRQGLESLSEFLKDSGLCLTENDGEIALTTSPEMSDLVEKVAKNEREGDLGRAGLETLAIIAYKGPVSRREIEYIRGVNCQFSLQTLLLRGLVERQTKEGDERTFLYKITMNAIMHLGIKSASELPEYDNIRKQTKRPSADIDIR